MIPKSSLLLVSETLWTIMSSTVKCQLLWRKTTLVREWNVLQTSLFTTPPRNFKLVGTSVQHILKWHPISFSSIQFSSVAQPCPTLCNPMNRSSPGFPVHHQLPEFTQTHVYRVSDAIQPSHPLLSPSPPAPNPFQHRSLFQWVNSSHEVAKVLEFQL